MEESKKKTPTWLIILLSVLGVCLVGFCVWYGINYFKGEDKPVETPAEETNNQTDNVYHTYIVYSSKASDNYKSVDYSKPFVLKPYPEAEQEVFISDDNVITLSEKSFPETKGKSLKSEDKIISALIDYSCAGLGGLYYLTDNNNLYYANLDVYCERGYNCNPFESILIVTGVEKIGYARLNRFTTCGEDIIAYKKLNNDVNYAIQIVHDNETNKLSAKSTDMKYANWEEALINGENNLLVLYKNYPTKLMGNNPIVLKNENGKDLYVKGVFASSEQLDNTYGYPQLNNKLFLLSEDDYLYHYPNGYSATNVNATKYSATKVKSIKHSGTSTYEPSTLTIEYVDGKTEIINIESYDGCVNLNL